MNDDQDNGKKAPEAIQPWQLLAVQQLLECRIFTVESVRRRSPASGRAADFVRIGSADWVNVVAVTDSGDIVLIKQYRHGSDEITLEIPGGIIDPGETPGQAGLRELLEETGYIASRAVVIGRVRSNPAIMNNWTYTVLATGLTKTGTPAPDEHEEIQTLTVPAGQTDELLRNGQITHALVIDALTWYRLHMQAQ